MAVPIVMPKLGQIMVEGVVNKWHKAAGEVVVEGEVIAEIETEKLNYDLEATAGGVFHPVAPEGAVVAVDEVMGYVLDENESPPEVLVPETPVKTSAPAPLLKPNAPEKTGGEVRSSPGARKLAAHLGIDIAQITPTGPRGRVVEADVRLHADLQSPGTITPSIPPGLEPSETVPIAGMRKSIAGHMKSSLADTAQLTFSLEVDVTEAQRLRRENSRSGEVNLTIGSVFIKACAQTLKRHPEHNTLLVDGNILYFNDVNIGMAVSVPDGLIVPVVQHADKKSILEIAVQAQELAEKARDGKILPDHLLGGTFTISVLGSVDAFTPILNSGQSAILGVGRSLEKPVVKKGEVVVREMMTVSLTVDHQVIDGAAAAGFLRRLQQAIERPAALFK